MSTLWLRDIDFLSRAAPPGFFRWLPRAPRGTAPVILLRPGGLGDLVILSRAVLELGVSADAALWIIERRNSPWAKYLGLPYLCYDNLRELWGLLKGQTGSHCVINTEQRFGLSSLLAERLVLPGGQIVGFSSNCCAAMFDQTIEYRLDNHELYCFNQLLSAAEIAVRLPSGEHKVENYVPATPERSYVVVAIAGLQEDYKRIGVSKWRTLVREAIKESASVVVVGTRQDRAFSEEVCASFGSEVENLTGELEFPAVVETVKLARCLYSVDSGLVHIADFFGVPSQVVFTSGLYQKWGPLTAGSRVLNPDELRW